MSEKWHWMCAICASSSRQGFDSEDLAYQASRRHERRSKRCHTFCTYKGRPPIRRDRESLGKALLHEKGTIAIVRSSDGTKKYQVSARVGLILECSCPATVRCKHIGALFGESARGVDPSKVEITTLGRFLGTL